MNKNYAVVPLLSGSAASLLISHQMTKNEEGKRLKTLPGSKCCSMGSMLVGGHRHITQS